MTVCPIAIVAGCQKCPAFKICPLKGVLGDKPAAAAEPNLRRKHWQSHASPQPAGRNNPYLGATLGFGTRLRRRTISAQGIFLRTPSWCVADFCGAPHCAPGT
jgi:hypothetical protein